MRRSAALLLARVASNVGRPAIAAARGAVHYADLPNTAQTALAGSAGPGGLRGFAASAGGPDACTATCNLLYSSQWKEIEPGAAAAVEVALSSNGNSPNAGKLRAAWAAAQAVEKFCQRVELIRVALEDEVGLFGEDAKPLPDRFATLLAALVKNYHDYLAALGPEEADLKRKVVFEAGKQLLVIRQRVGGLGDEWANIGVLGTTGIAGSYVESAHSS